MLTLRARHFSKIKGIVQYIRRKGSAKSKESISTIEEEVEFSAKIGLQLFGFLPNISYLCVKHRYIYPYQGAKYFSYNGKVLDELVQTLVENSKRGDLK